MNDEMDDMIDSMLCEQFDGPVPNDGFSERVMTVLPARRRRTKWPMAAGIFAGIAAWGFTLSSAPLAVEGWRDWLSGIPSAPAITLIGAMLSMAFLALAWIVAEADDQSALSTLAVGL